MNQTKKRLSIIKIAISITDIETIQLQILKLGFLKTDEKIQTIIAMLQAENYAQAQGLISTYIETPTENILQRSAQEEESIVDEFQLFSTTEENQNNSDIDINDFLSVGPTFQDKQTEDLNTKTPPKETSTLDSLLNINADDVLANNIELNINYSEEDNFFALPNQSTQTSNLTCNIPKDTFFDISSKETPQNVEEKDVVIEKSFIKKREIPLNTDPIQYMPIPYIDQKLKSINKQYPSVHSNDEPSPALSTLLTKISQETYSEQEIEETLEQVKSLVEDQQFAEATQLLLLCASTPSSYAQFILARELYKGILLTQNIPQAFILLTTLAMNDYPEALCDLGQFYENGIGTKKDKKRAKELYKEAMNLGIKRAGSHYKRLKQKKKGFFRR